MNGREEKEQKARAKMQAKLADLPEIFTLFYDWLDARDKTHTTINNYINHIIDFKAFCDKRRKNEFYENVTDGTIEKYMTTIKRKIVDGEEIQVGDDHRAAKWSSLNTFFKFLSQKNHITNNPMLLTERPKVRTEHNVTYMTTKEIESVFARIAEDARPMTKNRDMCIMAMGLGTGLRVSAIVNINIEDIDFAVNTIKVVEKGRKVREIRFAENLRNMILIWMKDREISFNGDPNSGPLFISQRKTRMSVDSVEHLVKKYTNHLPKKITPHKLRSSAATNLAATGVSVQAIAKILGHSNIQITQRYVDVLESETKEATNYLDSLI